MFTQYNTESMTDEQIDALNAELETRLDGVTDPEQRSEIEKNFNDEVSRR